MIHGEVQILLRVRPPEAEAQEWDNEGYSKGEGPAPKPNVLFIGFLPEEGSRSKRRSQVKNGGTDSKGNCPL